MNNTARCLKITVSADGRGLVPQAGTLLLAEAAQVTGLGQALTAGLARWRARRGVHDAGKIIADLVKRLRWTTTAWPISRCCSPQPDLAGRGRPGTRGCPGSSRPWPADAPRALRAIRKAHAAAPERARALTGDGAPGADRSLIPVGTTPRS